jgi:predicted ThiF/HesA family dinucleotide-utilizing enzyme
MSEVIPIISENETTAERVFWDRVIRAVALVVEASEVLVEQGEDFGKVDFAETVESLRDETEEDALMLLYNYVVMLSVGAGQPVELDEIHDFLAEMGLVEID